MVSIIFFIYFSIKDSTNNTSHFSSIDILNFDFDNRVCDYVTHQILCIIFTRKIFLMLCSINWPNFIFWLPTLFDILGNMSIVIICLPDCDVINFEINHSVLIKVWQTNRYKYFKILRTKEAFHMNLKAFLIIFKGVSLKEIKKFP